MTRRNQSGRERRIPVTFTARERDLLREHTFADPVYADRIKGAEGGGVARSSPSELDDILGYLAAAANHTRSRKLQDELDVLYDPLEILVEAEGVHSRDEF
jgi:hypothetical protein